MDELDLDFLSDFEWDSQGTTASYLADVASDFPDLFTLTDSLFPETQTTSSLDVNNNEASYSPMELLPTSLSTGNTGDNYSQQQQQPMNIQGYNPNLYGSNNSVSYAQVPAIPANPYGMSGYTAVTPINHIDTQQSSQPPQSVNPSMAMGPNLNGAVDEYPHLPTNTNAPVQYDTQNYTSIGSTGSTLYPDPSATTVNLNMSGASMITPVNFVVPAVDLNAKKAKKTLTPHEKLKLKRERNRLAARKCHQKKLDNIARYEKRLGELQQDTDTLEEEIGAMRERSRRLKLIYLENNWEIPVRISGTMAGKDKGGVKK